MEATKVCIKKEKTVRKKEKTVRKDEQPLVVQPGMLIVLNG